ncbi:tRNA wybutosine-synthesizing protein 2 [Geosmithia morbida]|uniref:tRNA wybutosine-synthesizing protein 2 n=1 Tax=Geosmithia morbida TaxID=1094350 RepID=A0A9P5D5D6_9HYPO|nr:tRNA wybutosine-synthesizing protein 2 [Geosmithia morbida]KAF4123680.1 tRNA wybutosine-synthesizing protein 2 [Geosmithia morbida]
MTKQCRENPIRKAVRTWAEAHVPDEDYPGIAEQLVGTAPKRFTIYEPMVLLPSASFTHETWTTILSSSSDSSTRSLWRMILEEISGNEGKRRVTHLAVNEAIPPVLRSDSDADPGDQSENVLRSPSGLRMLHGDFGGAEEGAGTGTRDFEGAFWVRTRQNGILQTWAPRWTMFSRGNVKEKARLLGFPKAPVTDAGERQQWAVDLYAGIGYFVFSYASLGMKVLCWEMNAWSVEGLRRGAAANRWGVRVVSGSELEGMSDAQLVELVRGGGQRITVFLEDNQRAAGRVRTLQGAGLVRAVTHVNCGLLPTSEPTWDTAWDMTVHSDEAWLHLHDNVGVDDVQGRSRVLQSRFEERAAVLSNGRHSRVDHVEKVKTYAPGVWHCVFDIHITS